MGGKLLFFDGQKFTRDDKTRYYLCEAGKRQRLHVYVWEYYNGPVPAGFHVHFIDGNKSNNDISNLMALDQEEHLSFHAKQNAIAFPERTKAHAARIQPLTKAWHRSEQGREWHKSHYSAMKDKLQEKKAFKCEKCETEFVAVDTGKNRFCSNACKSAWRRASGVDDISRICENCGKEFRINKYAKKRFCSTECSYQAVPRGGTGSRDKKH